MKTRTRKFFIIVLLCLSCLSACDSADAQTKQVQAETPSVVTPDQQQAFTEAVQIAQTAQTQADAAQARLEAAQARIQAIVFKVMATLKLSPDDFRAVLKEGKLSFERIERK
jgi:protein-disulfide isomerase